MTEKRKRGRPRKVKLDKDIIANIEPVTAEIDEKLANYNPSPEAVQAVSMSVASLKRTIASEKAIPPAGLSKVATLQWLTEQNAKK